MGRLTLNVLLSFAQFERNSFGSIGARGAGGVAEEWPRILNSKPGLRLAPCGSDFGCLGFATQIIHGFGVNHNIRIERGPSVRRVLRNLARKIERVA